MLVSKNNDLKLVRNLMHIGVTTCPADMPVLEAARLLYTQDIESLIVLDENGHSAGVFGKKEAAQIYAQTAGNGAGLQTLTVADAMRADILEVPPDIPAPAAAQIMLDQARREIHLLHHAGGIGWPAAVFRFEDILRYLAAETEADVAALGVGAPRKSAIELFRERYAKKT